MARPQINVRIEPDGLTLERFIQSQAKAKFIQGPVRSGKTTAVIHALQYNAIGKQPLFKGKRRRKTIVVRNTYKQLIDTVIPSIMREMPEDIWGPISISGRPRRLIKMRDLEWEWLFYAMDKPQDVEDFKSLEASDIWISEYRYVPREIMAAAVERIGQFPSKSEGGCVSGQLMGETNAPMEDHWSAIMSGQQQMPEGLSEDEKRRLVCPAGWEFFVQPPGLIEKRSPDGKVIGYEQNPLAENQSNLNDPRYYENAVGIKSDEEIRTELMNKPGRVRSGRPVWGAFRDDRHVARAELEAMPGHPIIVGQDFGRTPASVFCQVVFGRWRVLGEFWAENMGAAAYADALKPFMATRFPGFQFVIYGDPAGAALSQADENSPLLMFRAKGLRVVPAPTNDPEIRVNAVDQLLRRDDGDGGPAFMISPRCRALIAAMGGGYMLRRMVTAVEQYSEQPVKDRHSHIADALQYAVVGGGEGRALISTVGPQFSQTRFGQTVRRPAGQVIMPMGRGRGWGGIGRR
jgi:hypothetical protein